MCIVQDIPIQGVHFYKGPSLQFCIVFVTCVTATYLGYETFIIHEGQ